LIEPILGAQSKQVPARSKADRPKRLPPADHAGDAAERAFGLEFGAPIRIGCNVWIVAGAIILPGAFPSVIMR
jgi:acetyltransferase-like isoleucine patch superfamily enzyme